MTDQQALGRVLRRFARTMADTYDTSEALRGLAGSVVEVLGATAAGVGLLDDGRLRFVSATSDAAAQAERVQERLQNGACVESMRTDVPVAVTDVRAVHDRWPGYASEIEAAGFRAVLGLPLAVGDRLVGSLDAYCTVPHVWSDDTVEAARVLADLGAAFVVNASALAGHRRTEEQLRATLNASFATEQATGVLAARLGVTVVEAFDRLREAARRQGVHMADLAHQVIDGYTPD